jgi:hypothetical protein
LWLENILRGSLHVSQVDCTLPIFGVEATIVFCLEFPRIDVHGIFPDKDGASTVHPMKDGPDLSIDPSVVFVNLEATLEDGDKLCLGSISARGLLRDPLE